MLSLSGFIFLLLTTGFGLEPSLNVPVVNVTVSEGQTAILPCSVDFLGGHKVIWTDQQSTLLTLFDNRIIDDPRISIERHYTPTRDWYLQIQKVTYNDTGVYKCQINTNPVKAKSVMLIVQVSSRIIHELSSGDMTAKEGQQVTLVCNVTGVPKPKVTWYRLVNESVQQRLDLEAGTFTIIDSCVYTLKQTGIGMTGEVLIIHNLSRYCDSMYTCVAYNNVWPAVTRQMMVFVEFAPEVSLPKKRIGQYVGEDTRLDCEITAYPHALMYWMKEGIGIDHKPNNKYQVELFSGTKNSKTLSLHIKDIREDDFGEYLCYARNSISYDSEKMLLYDNTIHTKTKTMKTKHTTPGLLHSTLFPSNKDSFGKNGFTLKPVVNQPKHTINVQGQAGRHRTGQSVNQPLMPDNAIQPKTKITKTKHTTPGLLDSTLFPSNKDSFGKNGFTLKPVVNQPKHTINVQGQAGRDHTGQSVNQKLMPDYAILTKTKTTKTKHTTPGLLHSTLFPSNKDSFGKNGFTLKPVVNQPKHTINVQGQAGRDRTGQSVNQKLMPDYAILTKTKTTKTKHTTPGLLHSTLFPSNKDSFGKNGFTLKPVVNQPKHNINVQGQAGIDHTGQGVNQKLMPGEGQAASGTNRANELHHYSTISIYTPSLVTIFHVLICLWL